MAWLFLGFLLLLAAALERPAGPLRIAALALAAAALAFSFQVYPGWGPPAALAAALLLAWPLSRFRSVGPVLRPLLIAAGAACCAFSRFGPAEGLF